MKYEDFTFKIPVESPDYSECSKFAVCSITQIVENAINRCENQIILRTNLKCGLPMENINKIAGPLVEAWAFETFQNVLEECNEQKKYSLIHVEAMPRLNRADIILQFRKERPGESGITAEIDVKSTSEDIENSGKSPNITSFERIRSAYLEDPDLLFVILSLKHRVYSQPDDEGLKSCVMEIVSCNAYDLKFLSRSDLSYNPALGTGQIQVKDIHYVSMEHRTTWEFCQMLDQKFISSHKGQDSWFKLAVKNEWIKTND